MSHTLLLLHLLEFLGVIALATVADHHPRVVGSVLILLAGLTPLAVSQQTKPQSKSTAAVAGVFAGRSGKPMAKARLYLGQVVGDRDVASARIKLPPSIDAVTCDAQGHFEFKRISPGEYTILYLTAGSTVLVPTEIGIKSLMAEARSIAPLLRGQEFGTSEPLTERTWGDQYTLLKGHTFYLLGQGMKIWNATARRGQQGPYIEIRRGLIWLQKLDDKSQIKLVAWSY